MHDLGQLKSIEMKAKMQETIVSRKIVFSWIKAPFDEAVFRAVVPFVMMTTHQAL